MTIHDDDTQLFRRMMQGVTPLKSRLRPTIRPPIQTPRVTLPPLPPAPRLSNPLDLDISAETLLSYGKQRLAYRQFMRLARGEVPIQARCDLHGLIIDAAHDECTDFITLNQQRGLRCVLIIHGKGGQHAEYSLLKSHVNHWLKQMPQVLAFHSAQPQHGGRGAVYVLLKAIVNKR
jgi:DNA-nicking Smr family endonuclease